VPSTSSQWNACGSLKKKGLKLTKFHGNRSNDPGRIECPNGVQTLHPQREAFLSATDCRGSRDPSHRTYQTPPTPIFTYNISNNRLASSALGQATWPEKHISHPCFALYRPLISSFYDPALPLLFFACSLPHEFSFLFLVIGIPHAVCPSIAYRLMPYLTTHFRPPVLVPFVGCEKLDAAIWNLSCVRTYGVLRPFPQNFEKRSSCPSVRPSARMEQLRSHQMDFHEIWYLQYFSKLCRENYSFDIIWQESCVLYMKTELRL